MIFDYGLKIKLILSMVFLSLIMLVFLLVSYQDSRADDLTLVSQLQVLASGLERYYDKFQSYPEAKRVAVENIRIISENGLNQSGNTVYYKVSGYWPRSAVLASDREDYTIEFTLDNSWSIWPAQAGGACLLKSGMIMDCQ